MRIFKQKHNQQKSHNVSVQNVVQKSIINEHFTDKTLFITYTNYGYLNYVYNFLKSTEKIPWKCQVVCVDQKSYDELLSKNVPVILLEGSFTTEFQEFGSPQFFSMNWFKLDIIKNLFELYPQVETIVYMDSDVVIQKDFTTLFEKYIQELSFDIMFQCDVPYNNCKDENCENLCAGIMILKRSQNTLNSLNYRAHFQNKTYIAAEQSYLNDCKERGMIKVKTLPVDTFPNGYYIIRHQTHPDAYVVHYNYMMGQDKIFHMRNTNNWLI